MWNFLMGILFVRATGTARLVRFALLLILIGAVAAGLIYAHIVFNAVNQRSHTPHVHAYSTR